MSGMKIAFSPEYVLPVPDGHRFPMLKYELVPQQLLYEGTCQEDDFFIPIPAKRSIVNAIHCKDYMDSLDNLSIPRKDHIKIGLPFTKTLIEREYLITGGVLNACDYAIEKGISLSIAGGTHHAFPERGEGFCVFNDAAVASKYLIDNNISKSILIIDLDVHQGNGTAKCLENESAIFTFSMHCDHNYPLQKEFSDLDIPLQVGTTDSVYLEILNYQLDQLIDKLQPDFIFFNAGVDVLASDKLGKLKLSIEGCKQRDEFVLNKAKELNIPIVVTMGGGYSPDISVIVEAHCNTFRLAREIFF